MKVFNMSGFDVPSTVLVQKTKEEKIKNLVALKPGLVVGASG
jgi:hypothetical protein